MTTIHIFDPAMCCSGTCGPRVDPELARVAASVHMWQEKGAHIKRFNLADHSDAFLENETVHTLMQEKGPGILPIIFLNGEVVKERMYPTDAEFTEWLGAEAGSLQK
ncbi:arsenite efflux transporter metallochaperone ArsD [Domibacillus indicus]|uniref:arsenite efflux transporter metallochaperone ArsD n=1 Tax=Domibacillus indicus TaxID=1437523 RepID=UPI0020424B39|nr:arsenite efflux transporter metallochaperone ArsD [Domibacillus indicus]MCM3790944.1 arsenite efflux transporter metallochaperone ArsD [Domibacillus indicus]